MASTARATLRGDRRAHEQRVAARRKRRFPFYVQKHQGKTPGKICSCEMCGNCRGTYGPTRQELISQLDEPTAGDEG